MGHTSVHVCGKHFCCLVHISVAFCIAASVDQSSTSSNVSLVLSELSTRFCGCQTIDGGVDLAFPGVMAGVPFTENTFNFLYHLREITGYLRVSNLPQTSRLSLPNLILIRGRELTVLGNGLEISGSQVDNVSLPQLREISSGNVSIHNSSWCGYLSVNWEDILEAGQLSVSENSTSCTQPGKYPDTSANRTPCSAPFDIPHISTLQNKDTIYKIAHCGSNGVLTIEVSLYRTASCSFSGVLIIEV